MSPPMPRLFALPLTLLAVAPLAAQDGKPEEVVARAVEAAGGAGLLNKYPAGRVTAKGVLHANGFEVPVTVEQTYHVPGRARTVVRMEVKGVKQEVVHVVNGAKVRYAINGATVPATDAAAKDIQLAALLLEVGQLTPLLTDRRFTLKPDRAAKGELAGVVVQAKGFPDVRLGFDRKTGQLVRVARKVTDPDTGKEGEVEQTFADFKPFAGLTKPTRVLLTRDGLKVLDLTTESFTPLEKVEPREFATDN
jgi:hypothetical protein